MAADFGIIVSSTIQAIVLSCISNVLAQLISSYQNELPFELDVQQLARFATFSILSSPPNVVWQVYLERRFPGYTSPSPPPSSSSPEKLPQQEPQKQRPQSLNKRNTAIKFALDQTLGALFNTVLFLAGMPLLRGERDLSLIWAAVRTQTLPLIRAGQTLWPLVSVVSFTLVPLEWRAAFGGLAGVLWGVYLSLIEGERS